MKRLAKYFGNGLLFLIPTGATVYVVYWIFSTIDGLVKSGLTGGDGVLPGWWHHGFGVLITLGVILVVGFLSTLFIPRPLAQLVENVFARLPLVTGSRRQSLVSDHALIPSDKSRCLGRGP